MSKLSEQENWKFGFATYPHTGSPFFITMRAVRAVVAHAIVVANQLWRSWQPVVLSAIVTYKPYLHVPTIVTQKYNTVKSELAQPHNKEKGQE